MEMAHFSVTMLMNVVLISEYQKVIFVDLSPRLPAPTQLAPSPASVQLLDTLFKVVPLVFTLPLLLEILSAVMKTNALTTRTTAAPTLAAPPASTPILALPAAARRDTLETEHPALT